MFYNFGLKEGVKNISFFDIFIAKSYFFTVIYRKRFFFFFSLNTFLEQKKFHIDKKQAYLKTEWTKFYLLNAFLTLNFER